ncbi:MAG: helix-turn-helix domain-containing protein [Thermoguttaceae bacterium]|nr:helix-turn-helix domain-containing protein [Thermoguttaceae bacterium]
MRTPGLVVNPTQPRRTAVTRLAARKEAPILENAPDIMTRREAALFLRISLPTLNNAIANDGLPYKKLGNRYIFTKASLISWVEGK